MFGVVFLNKLFCDIAVSGLDGVAKFLCGTYRSCRFSRRELPCTARLWAQSDQKAGVSLGRPANNKSSWGSFIITGAGGIQSRGGGALLSGGDDAIDDPIAFRG